MFSDDLKAKIRAAFDQLGNYRQVGRNFNISHQSVKYIVGTDENRPKKKRGPKFTLSRSQQTAIKREIRKCNSDGRRVTARSLKENLNLSNLSLVSVRRNVRRLGFEHKQVNQTIVLSAKHKQRRVELARKWLSIGHPWKLTVFTDEKKFNLDGPDSWSTWTDEDRNIYRNKRQMGGGGIMVWGLVLHNGFVHVERLEGKVNTDRYLEMLSEVLPNLTNVFDHSEFYFQQDNCSIHVSKKALEYFDRENVSLLEWPARSPDLNIMENVWHMLSGIIYENQQYQDKESLWVAIQEAADLISSEKLSQIDNLFSDMNKRLLEVVELRGNKIKR